MRRAAHLLVALTLGASSCGSAQAEEATVEGAVMESLEQRAGTGVLTTAEQRRCAAGSIVDAIGPSRLRTLGVTDGGGSLDRLAFTEDDLDRIGAALGACVAEADIVGDLLTELYPPESVECLVDELPPSFTHRTVAAAAIGLDPVAYESFFETLFDAEAACPPS